MSLWLLKPTKNKHARNYYLDDVKYLLYNDYEMYLENFILVLISEKVVYIPLKAILQECMLKPNYCLSKFSSNKKTWKVLSMPQRSWLLPFQFQIYIVNRRYNY